MFYYELFEALHKARVTYLVVGGLSVNPVRDVVLDRKVEICPISACLAAGS